MSHRPSHHRPPPTANWPLRAALWAACALAACASPRPPIQLHALHLAPHPARPDPLTPTPTPASASGAWQLLSMQLPAYLDRDALLLPLADGSLQAQPGHRWAEPLRDALPRLLGEDLGRLRGAASLWTRAPPPGVPISRHLRVDLLALDVLPGRSGVRLQARWSLADPEARSPWVLGRADIETAAAGPQPAQLVAAQRAALWQLAQRIASQRGTAGAAP